MSARRTRLDESLDSSTLQKALTGQNPTSIDLTRIRINNSGVIVPVQHASQQTQTATMTQSEKKD